VGVGRHGGCGMAAAAMVDGTRSTVNEPGRRGDQSRRRMDRIRSKITKDVIERLWSN